MTRVINPTVGCHYNASNYVPKHHVNFHKFWWSQELSCLKEKAIISDNLWKDAGRPRSGQLFSHSNSDKRAYKYAIRNHESDSVGRYTNQLNDALLLKRGNDFRKCWNSKFSSDVSKWMVLQTRSKLLTISKKILLLSAQLFKVLLTVTCNIPMNILGQTMLAHLIWRSTVLMLN